MRILLAVLAVGSLLGQYVPPSGGGGGNSCGSPDCTVAGTLTVRNPDPGGRDGSSRREGEGFGGGDRPAQDPD